MHVNIRKEEHLLCKLFPPPPIFVEFAYTMRSKPTGRGCFLTRIWFCPFMSDFPEGGNDSVRQNPKMLTRLYKGLMVGCMDLPLAAYEGCVSAVAILRLFFFFFCHITLQPTLSVPQHEKTTGITALRFYYGCTKSCLGHPEM